MHSTNELFSKDCYNGDNVSMPNDDDKMVITIIKAIIFIRMKLMMSSGGDYSNQ